MIFNNIYSTFVNILIIIGGINLNILTLFLLALALATDAFAVSVSLGLSVKPFKHSYAFISAASFGLFQGIMPLLGFLSSIALKDFVDAYSNIIAFVLLFFIGSKMIYEVYQERKSGEDTLVSDSFSIKNILILSIATSIDAFASGISLAMLNVNIVIASLFIAVVTFVLCILGFYFGKKIGSMFKHKAQVIGGIVLIAIACKSLIG